MEDLTPTRSMLSNMVEVCEELDKKSVISQEEYLELNNQVAKAQLIFDNIVGRFHCQDHMTPTASQSVGCGNIGNEGESTDEAEDAPATSQDAAGCSHRNEDNMSNVTTNPSDMIIILKHLKLCTSILRKRIGRMGEENIFSLESYLAALRSSGGENEIGGYSARTAFRNLCQETAFAFQTMPGVPCILGALNHKEYLSECKELARKVDADQEQTTRRTKTKAKVFDKNITVHEELEASQCEREIPEGKEISSFRNVLRKHCKDNRVSEVGFLDLCINKNSVHQSAKNMFETSFGIRDGHIALDTSTSGTLMDIKVSPAGGKKKKNPVGSELNNRSQCIVSLSAADIRMLIRAAEGENIVDLQSQPNEKLADS